jgi:hypothetical protein
MANGMDRHTITRRQFEEDKQELIRRANATMFDSEPVIIPGTEVRIESRLVKQDEELDKTLILALQAFHKKPVEIVD